MIYTEYILIKILCSIGLSLIVFFTHSFFFKFLLNKNTLFLTMMLPCSILVVTQAISSNLYLSLGLIGALSIVRYRTPVKSQYELAYLFCLITIGIVSGVDLENALIVTLVLALIPFIYKTFEKKLKFLGNSETRLYNDGTVTVIAICDDKKINNIEMNPQNGMLLRIDSDFRKKVNTLIFSFESITSAKEYSLKIKKYCLHVSLSN